MAAKEFLDEIIGESNSLSQMTDDAVSHLFGNEKAFTNAKRDGVGRETILKFLGANWKQWMIQEALTTINDKAVGRAAIDELPSMGHAREFRQAVKEHKIPKAKQRAIATENAFRA